MWKWSSLKRLLKAKDEISSSACIMWPVGEEIPGVDEPHVTAIYLGDVANLDKEEVLAAMRDVHFAYDAMLIARVKRTDWFGPDKNVPVLLVEHNFLYRYRDAIEAALNKRGIKNGSEFNEYKPHITVTDYMVLTGNHRNSYVLTQPELWWGREHLRP